MHKNSTPRWLMVALGLAALALLAGGAWFYRAQKQALRREAEANLTAIAQLKVNQIVQWRSERLADAAVITESPFFIAAVARWMAAPQANDTDQLLTRFRSLQEHDGYRDVLLADASGQVRLSLSGYVGPLHDDAAQALAAALGKRRPTLGDLYPGPGDLPPHIDAFAPFFAENTGGSEPLGVVILQSDARQFLYPLLQSWPMPSDSAETLLVRRDGDHVLFLNDLRFQPGTALTLRIPLDQTKVPAVMAVLGKEGMVQGRDYRGVEVLSALEAVPDSPWFLVAKMDAAEALSVLRREPTLILALLLGLVLIAAVGVAAVWQHNATAHYRALYQAEQRHRVTLISVGDGVIATDAEGRVELLNPVAEALTGWPQTEARGKPLAEVFRIVNEETRQPVEDPASRVLREGHVAGLANHTLLIARDGTERPIADAGAPIRGEQGEVAGVALIFRDQTEERAAQKALRESEARFRLLYEYAPLGYQSLDENGYLREVNQAWLDVLGYRREEVIGRWFGDFLTPAGRELFQQNLIRFKRTGVAHDIEYEVPHKDGSLSTISIEGRVVYDQQGHFLQTHCILTDITERKRMEEALRESEEKYRSLVERANDGIVIVQDGIVKYINARLAEMRGVTVEEVIGTPFTDHIYPDKLPEVVDRYKQRMAGEDVSPIYETALRRRDGSKIHAELNAGMVTYQGTPADLVIVRDITERKRMEEALAAERSLLRTLVDHLPDAIYVKDGACRKTLANPVDVRNMGASSEAEALGKTDFDFFPHDLAAAFYADDQSVIQSGRPVLNREEMITLPDGTRGWQLTSKVAVRDSTGQVVGLVGIGHDITERKRVEEEIRRHAARLEALRQVSLKLATELDLDALLRSIVEQAMALVGGRWGSFELYRPELDALVSTAMTGNGPDLSGTPLRRGEGLVGQVWESGQPLVVDDYQHWAGQVAAYEGLPIRANVGVPVRWGDEFLGVLNIESETVGAFTPDDTELLGLFAAQAAIAIHNARLFEAERATREQAEKLRAATQALSASLDLQQVFERILTELRYVVPYDSASVQQLKGNRLEIIGGHGFPNLEKLLGESFDLTAQDNPNREVVRTRAPLILDDAPARYEGFRREPHVQAGTRAWLGVPLLFGERLIGLIALDKREPGSYTQEHARLALAFGAQAAIAIENARLYRQAIQAAERRAVLHRASQEIVSAFHDPEQVYQAIHRAAAALMPTEAFVIVLRDEAGQQNEPVYLIDRAGRWSAQRIPANQGLSGQVITSGQSLLIDDLTFETVPQTVHFGGPEPVRAILAVPLRLGERVIGMISAQSYQPEVYTAEDQVLLEMLAAHAAAVLENARLFQHAQQRVRDLSQLFEASVALSTSLDLDTVLHTIAQHTVAALGIEGCAISLWDRERDVLVTLLDYSPDPDWRQSAAPGDVYPLARFPVSRRVLSSRQPLTVRLSDPAADPGEVAWMRAEAVVSLLMVPLVVSDRVIGLLELMETRQERTFSPTEIGLCQTLANQAAAALENARLYDEAQRRNRELALLNRVIAASAAGQTIEPILDTVCRELAAYFDVPQSAAALFDEDKTQAVVVAEYLAPGRPSALGESIPVADNPASQHLLAHKTPLVIEDAQTDPRQAPIRDLMQRRGTASLLLLPLMVDGEVVGSLGVDAVEPRAFSVEEVNLAWRVTEQLSGVLTRARLQHEHRQLEEQFLQAQKMEAVGRLAGGVAHDFNNLLTVIYLSTRLLERKLRPEDPLWQHVQRIQDAGRRAANLTKQLLAFSRREIVEPRVLSLNQVLGDLHEMLRRLISEDIELATRLADDLWPVKVDPTQVEQVVVNLAVNARDAMPSGGSLTIETANVVLDEAHAARHLEVEPGEYVLLGVSDTGVGMNEEVKAHLFEPFFTTKEKGRGTGLGLATVFGIVNQNRGHIEVYSEVGQGTAFKIYLPRAGMPRAGMPRVSEGAPAPSRPLQPAAARGTETLLLVEDEALVRELTRGILLGQGYQVLTARDGVEALQVAEAHEGPIHLLLTDVIMPRMSGKALADCLRTSRPEMRVLFTSGYTDNAIVHHGVLAAGVHFLSKPFEMESLAWKVRDALDATETTLEWGNIPSCHHCGSGV